MSEQWRPVPGHEGRYEVSDHGQVRSLIHPYAGRVLRPGLTADGYAVVSLAGRQRKTVKVHRLVLLAFDRPPNEGEEVRHLNGDPGDNRRANLAWGTHEENMRDRVRHGTDRNVQKTHCPRGHLLDSVVPRGDGRTYRRCSTCREASQRRSNAKRDYATIVRTHAVCQHCGVDMRADGILRHVRRMHSVGRAA